jgi:hypothetical protein
MKAQRLWALMLLGLFVFNQPILGMVERAFPASNPPALFLYLFGMWALLIFLLRQTLR